jgi:hypothetical protein
MIVHITCQTDRFNLSVAGPDFINDCCFGEDFSRWLVAALCDAGIDAGVICMEDFGWANEVRYQGGSYLMCVSGCADGDARRPNYGQWHVLLERHRTFWQRLSGKNRTTCADPIVDRLVQMLRAAGFEAVQLEGAVR